MRISDWSSDVCSSDLGPQSACAPRAGSSRKTSNTGSCCCRRNSLVGLRSCLLVDLRGLQFENSIASAPANAGAERPMHQRSEERRVGKEWVSTCNSRWLLYH